MACIALLSLPAELAAQSASGGARNIDISARTLRRAIAELSREAHVSIGADGRLPSLRTNAVRGTMTVGTALERLLSGTGYTARRVGNTAWRIETAPRSATPAPAAAAPAVALRTPLQIEPAPPIIVTATKTARDLLGLPVAMARIEMAGRTPHLADSGSEWVAARMDGIALSASGAGRNRMFLRGVADSPFTGESQSTVAIVLDSARITYSAPDPDIRLVDIDRVEVLKGPQGSLYGAGALGGIYQIRTNRPQMGEASLAVSSEVSGMVQGDAGYGGTVTANLPVAGESAALRLVGYSLREGGWVDTGSRRDSNSQTIFGGRMALGIEAAGDWRIDLGAMTQRINAADSQYVYEEEKRSRPVQLAEPHDNDITLVSAHAEGPLGAMQLSLDSSFIWHEVRDTLDATRGAGAFGVSNPTLLHDDRAYRIWNGEVRLDGELGAADWLLGVARIEAKQAVTAQLDSATEPAPTTIDDDRRLSAETALFGSFHLPLGGHFNIEAGARLFTGLVQDTRLVGGQLVTHDLHRTGLTPSLALSWQAGEQSLLFLRYGSAFRQGGVDIGADGELESFDSDELATLEAGWRAGLPRGGQLELGAYATRWTNVQSDMLLPSGLIETMNVGDAAIFGLEASWQQDFGSGWHLGAGGSIVRGMLVHDTSGVDLSDRRLPVVPEYTVRADIARDLVIGGHTGSAGLHLSYLGPAHLSFDPALDRDMGNVVAGQFEAHLNFGRWNAGLLVDNLFQRSADTFAFGNRLRILAEEQFTPLRPMRATLSLATSF